LAEKSNFDAKMVGVWGEVLPGPFSFCEVGNGRIGCSLRLLPRVAYAPLPRDALWGSLDSMRVGARVAIYF